MQLAPAGSALSSYTPFRTAPNSEKHSSPLSFRDGQGAPARLNASLQAETLSVQRYALDIRTSDGDRVTFSMESIQYQKAQLDIEAEGSASEMKAIARYVTDQYASMKGDLIRSLRESLGLDEGKIGAIDSPAASGEVPKLGIPEYWNAENTSQRIVDFATSFFSAFEGAGSEFLDTIKNAIEEGFKQARGLLGNLPDQVESLVDDTYDLTMKKLDSWAEANGIAADPQNAETQRAAA